MELIQEIKGKNLKDKTVRLIKAWSKKNRLGNPSEIERRILKGSIILNSKQEKLLDRLYSKRPFYNFLPNRMLSIDSFSR